MTKEEKQDIEVLCSQVSMARSKDRMSNLKCNPHNGELLAGKERLLRGGDDISRVPSGRR